MKFLSFAAKQIKPCHTHRRYICGQCTQYGMCFRMGCSCVRFTPSSSAKGQICTCGHTNRTHELEPMDNLDEEDTDPHTNFTSEKMRNVFEGRVMDQHLPDDIRGVQFADAISHKPLRAKTPKSRSSGRRTAASVGILGEDTERAAIQVEAHKQGIRSLS